MKKIIAVLLTVFILASMPVAVSADSDATLICTPSGESLSPGDEVVLTVSLENAANAKSIALVFQYDAADSFALVKGDWLLSGALLANFDSQTTECGTAAIAYLMPTDMNGNIFSLTLRVKENAPLGKTAVSVTPVIKNDAVVIACEEATVELTITDGTEVGSSINSVSISLGSDITLNYHATLAPNQESAQMRFTMNGKETMVAGMATGDEYVFSFGVSPQCMGDNIRAELILADAVLDSVEEYSVRQNCLALLADHPSDELKTLIADLLEYGAMSQIYTNHNVDMLVNEGVSGQTVFAPLADDEENELYVSYELGDSSNDAYEFTAAGVYFDSVNRLYFKFRAEDVSDEKFEVVITDLSGKKVSRLSADLEQIGENLYMVYTDPIYASKLSFNEAENDYFWYSVSLNTVKYSRGKRVLTPVQELNYYSLASYVSGKQNDGSAMSDLAKALYNYGLSAATYRNTL